MYIGEGGAGWNTGLVETFKFPYKVVTGEWRYCQFGKGNKNIYPLYLFHVKKSKVNDGEKG